MHQPKESVTVNGQKMAYVEGLEGSHASLFLASDEAKYITGHMLVVDGGITCKIS